MIEGEEEVGSDNLEHFVRANPEKLGISAPLNTRNTSPWWAMPL